MSEEPTTPPEDSAEPKKMKRFGNPDARREPADNFWDLDSADDAAMRIPEKPRESLPAPFTKGEEPKSDDDSPIVSKAAEPRFAAKGHAFVKTNITRDGGDDERMRDDGNPRMFGDFGLLDGEEEPQAARQEAVAAPPVEAVQEPEPESQAEQGDWVESTKVVPRGGSIEGQKSSGITRGIVARAGEKNSAGENEEDDEKRKPLDARLQAQPADAVDHTEEFSERKVRREVTEDGQNQPREVGIGDLFAWLRKLSLIEKAGMVVMLLVLAGFASVMFFPAIIDLPGGRARVQAEDFPQKGANVTVKSADTYWREPVLDGPNADVVRRETVLIPVIEMEVTGNAAVRVLFRNSDGESVGDPVTRAVAGDAKISFPGTAGFDQEGLHAAYRTGQMDVWSVEVYEAPSAGTAGEDFTKIFEMDLSAQLK